ncbi:hypothetical protein FBALC1_09847 [Flavobacteriales bacterium ALC-1]|nr:hypothetical protein FBALC1_09847 [Flavobacteriales bacterium ALC-1]
MKILIFGASGSGTTTLASSLAKKTGFPHLDVDDYYWKLTNPPFQEKVKPKIRQQNLLLDFQNHENVIVCGSMVSWGNVWKTAFDLVVFLYLKNDIRMQRLKNREIERYGKKLLFHKQTQENSKAFIEWANKYEDSNFCGRSLKIHNKWMAKIDCPILRIDGSNSLAEKTNFIQKHLKTKIN